MGDKKITHLCRWLILLKFTRFLGGPNGPKICGGRTKTDFKDRAPGEEDDGDFQHLENDDIAGEEKSEENAEEEENIRPPAHMQSSDRRPW